MAVNTKYTDPDSTAGGNGTTNALTGANRAYVSITAWEAATGASAATDSEVLICCSNHANHTADTSRWGVNGWTDKTGGNYILIQTEVSHGGKWNTSAHRCEIDTSASGGIFIYETPLHLKDLQIQCTGSSGASNDGILFIGTIPDGADVSVSRCILKGVFSGTATGINGIRAAYVASGARTCQIYNTLVYDFIRAGDNTAIGIYSSASWTTTTYNCTVDNCYYGYRRLNGTYNRKNCGASNCTVAANGTMTDTTCSATTPTYVNEAADDFHLASSDTTWRDQGTDQSGIFADDIDRVSRLFGGSWDIGADEYISTGETPAVRKRKIIILNKLLLPSILVGAILRNPRVSRRELIRGIL